MGNLSVSIKFTAVQATGTESGTSEGVGSFVLPAVQALGTGAYANKQVTGGGSGLALSNPGDTASYYLVPQGEFPSVPQYFTIGLWANLQGITTDTERYFFYSFLDSPRHAYWLRASRQPGNVNSYQWDLHIQQGANVLFEIVQLAADSEWRLVLASRYLDTADGLVKMRFEMFREDGTAYELFDKDEADVVIDFSVADFKMLFGSDVLQMCHFFIADFHLAQEQKVALASGKRPIEVVPSSNLQVYFPFDEATPTVESKGYAPLTAQLVGSSIVTAPGPSNISAGVDGFATVVLPGQVTTQATGFTSIPEVGAAIPLVYAGIANGCTQSGMTIFDGYVEGENAAGYDATTGSSLIAGLLFATPELSNTDTIRRALLTTFFRWPYAGVPNPVFFTIQALLPKSFGAIAPFSAQQAPGTYQRTTAKVSLASRDLPLAWGRGGEGGFTVEVSSLLRELIAHPNFKSGTNVGFVLSTEFTLSNNSPYYFFSGENGLAPVLRISTDFTNGFEGFSYAFLRRTRPGGNAQYLSNTVGTAAVTLSAVKALAVAEGLTIADSAVQLQPISFAGTGSYATAILGAVRLPHVTVDVAMVYDYVYQATAQVTLPRIASTSFASSTIKPRRSVLVEAWGKFEEHRTVPGIGVASFGTNLSNGQGG